MRVEKSPSPQPAPLPAPEPVRTSTYSLESALVPPQAPTFPNIARFFNWLWSWIRPFFFFIPKKVETPAPLAPDVLQTIRAAQARKNAPHPILDAVKQATLPTALCGGAVAWHFANILTSVAKKNASDAGTDTLLWATVYQGPLIIGALLSSKVLTNMHDFVRPLVPQPYRTFQRQVSYMRLAFVASVLYTEYKLYDAVTDGTIAGLALQPLATTADGAARYMWDNQIVQTPLGLTIPIIGIRLWQGGVPLIGIVKLTSSTAKKAINWIAEKAPYRVVKLAAKVVEVVGDTADELSTSVGKVKMGLGLGSTVLGLAKDKGPTLIAAGGAVLGTIGQGARWTFNQMS